MPHIRICACGHGADNHDSGGCCRANLCPCSHLVLSKADEFDPTEPRSPKSINADLGEATGHAAPELSQWLNAIRSEVTRIGDPNWRQETVKACILKAVTEIETEREKREFYS